MFFVCPGCEMPSTERPVIDGAVTCDCGHRRPWVLRPLSVLTGASGSGKTTVGSGLVGRTQGTVVLDSDILWGPEMDTPDDGYAKFVSTWLRLAANIAQSGHSALLVGSGVPEAFEARPERRYLGPIRWLALVPPDDILTNRLRARPAWRRTDSPEVLARMVEFNRQLADRSDMTKLDTGRLTIDETVAAVTAWLEAGNS